MLNEYTGGNAPYMYDQIMLSNATNSPSTVHCKNTNLWNFFCRYLLQEAMSVFRFDAPATWAMDNYALPLLYRQGFFAVVNTDKFGVIPQGCGLYGYNVMYQPTRAIIANPLLRGDLRPRIGTECALIRLQPDYGGIMDVVGYYADLMALAAEAAGMNLINSKTAFAFFAKNRAAAESYKKAFDKVNSGDPLVVMNQSLYGSGDVPAWQMWEQDIGQNFITDKLLACLRQIKNMFATDLGIPNANLDKKERMITDEVNANNVETATRCDMWLDTLRKSCDEANVLFPGINLAVNWRVDPYQTDALEEGVEDD